MIKFELPFPDKDLSPNARKHWAKVAKKKKIARADAYWMAKAHNWDIRPDEAINIKLDFYPEQNRAYDVDNMQARCKALLDGLADGWGVNDKLFKPVSEIYPKDGRARVEVTAWQY